MKNNNSSSEFVFSKNIDASNKNQILFFNLVII